MSTVIHREITTVYEPHPMSHPAIVKWYQQFEDGFIDLTVLERKITVQSLSGVLRQSRGLK